MDILKMFLPNYYSGMNQEDKQLYITFLVNDLCEKLKIDNIPVVFENLTNDQGLTIGGKFIYNPLCIVINEKFINGEEIEYLKQTGIDYNVAVPYFLVTTIAHECYHYFQFTLEKRLITGEELKRDLKKSAYLYFVCLHDKLFSSFNKKLGIDSLSKISDEDIYLYSPAELNANGFAYQIADTLGKFDTEKNYSQYRNFHTENYFKQIKRNVINGGNLISKSIEHSLQAALDFLNYKNKISGLKTNYLGIDVDELLIEVFDASATWREKEKKEIDVYNKITKKR